MLCAICEDVLSGTFEERARELVGRARKDPTWAREPHARHLGPAAQEDGAAADGRQLPGPVVDCQLLCPLRKLLDMNDIGVPWSRIYGTFPPKGRMAGTRGWHREEIQRC